MSINKVILVGRLTADPELRKTDSGNKVCNLRLATNESWTDKAGKRQERAEFHRVTAWGKIAESTAEYTRKGSLVYVEGSLRTSQWDDQQGVRRYSTDVNARSIQFLDRRQGKQPPAPETTEAEVMTEEGVF